MGFTKWSPFLIVHPEHISAKRSFVLPERCCRRPFCWCSANKNKFRFAAGTFPNHPFIRNFTRWINFVGACSIKSIIRAFYFTINNYAAEAKILKKHGVARNCKIIPNPEINIKTYRNVRYFRINFIA